MKKNTLPIVILGGIALVLAAALAYQNLGNPGGSTTLSKEEISKKIIEVIGKDVGDASQVSVDKIEIEGSLYKVSLNVLGQIYESYATLDGEYLFPQKVSLSPPKPKEIPKTAKPNVKLFVMSYCPYGNQAEDAMFPVVDLLKNTADIELHYVIYSDYGQKYPLDCLDKENKYCSMHGVQELNQGVRELCVQKYQKEKLWSFVKEMNTNSTAQDSDSKWEAIAKKLGIDVTKIKTCQKNEATVLLDQEIALTSKDYPVQDPTSHQGNETEKISGSPTIIINDMYYDGARSTSDYQSAICNAFTTKPEICNTTVQGATTTPAASGSCN
jgi:protein-disulfide isomerase